MYEKTEKLSIGEILTNNKNLALLIAVSIVGLIIISMFLFNKTAQAPTNSNLSTLAKKTADANLASRQNNVIEIDTQIPGNRAIVKSVDMPKAGWLVIREDKNGELSHILGGAYLPSRGHYTNQTVILQEGIIENEIYHLVIYDDDNQDRFFDYKTDQPIKDESGVLISKTFGVISVGSRGD